MTDTAVGLDGPVREAAPPVPGGPLGRWVLHPLLVVAYPTLALWGANVHEVPVTDATAVLWRTLAVGAVVWLVLAGLYALARRPNPVARAGLATSIAAVAVLAVGRVLPEASATTGLVVTGAVVVAGLVLSLLVSRVVLARLTLLLNVFSVVATVLALVALRPVLVPSRNQPVLVDFAGAEAPARDIWYIIPDRYPRAETLSDEYGFDNSDFESHLEDLGFSIQDQARANYPKTAHSLAATWNLDTVQDLVPEPPEDGADYGPLYDLLDDHRLGRFITDSGFDYLHLGSWWGPTAESSVATENRNLSTASEFETVWRTTTALRWTGAVTEEEGMDSRNFIRAITDYQLDELDALVTEPSDRPRFVLAHVTLPHEPYVYDADGSYVTAEEEQSRTRVENTVNQVEYVNQRLTDLVDRLVTGDPADDPIIVIQSDEGPHPEEQYAAAGGINWLDVDTEVRAEKLRTFSAWYLPGLDDEVPADITGVNTWRFILDRYFGTDLGLVDDRVWVFTDEQHLYDFTEVTDEFD
ncbi:sulfatase-like hydrolase/transferase [Salsipaludibacter albus]|uniref:sulfatase-like hydrolase/transferase n=1 Tax=Salsipaludibacter albus TaxID=2849650 RepID=UPI001EE45FD1|nr:sulfatase-like hydrolase/transferase [Salsipaludibacter albus]MBY5163542.1 LTA synthase family protein [Salsipaludibacter albus]